MKDKKKSQTYQEVLEEAERHEKSAERKDRRYHLTHPEDIGSARTDLRIRRDYWDPSEWALKKEQTAILYNVIKQNLDETNTIILVRTYFDGAKLKEVALELGISISSVSERRKRSQLKIKKLFSDYYLGESS